MSVRINRIPLAVRRVRIPREHEGTRHVKKTQTRDYSRCKVAKLLEQHRNAFNLWHKTYHRGGHESHEFARYESHQGIRIPDSWLRVAATNGWDYAQTAVRFGCSCLDVIQSLARSQVCGLSESDVIFVFREGE